MREVWESPGGPDIEGKRNVRQYIDQLKRWLKELIDESRVHADKMQNDYKKYYDRQSSERKLNVSEKVLVLMPTCNAKMFGQWSGEYPVTRCLDNVRYEIRLEKRKAIFHINSLKLFIER